MTGTLRWTRRELRRGAGVPRRSRHVREDRADHARRPRAHRAARRGDGRPAAGVPGDPHHRDQRQGLDVADDHPSADGPGADGRDLHQPAPRTRQRADRPQLRADRATTTSPSRSPRSPTSRVSPVCDPATSRRSPRRRCGGSPTSPSTSPSSRSGCSVAGTPPTWSTPRWPSITNIGMDHNEFAGPTLADIAREKAGIIKPRSAVLIGTTDPELVAVLAAEDAAARLYPRRGLRRRQQPARPRRSARRPAHADDDLPRDVRAPARRPPGRQRGDRPRRGRGVLRRPAGADEVVTEGFAAVQLHGRFDVLKHQPLVIVDGAHNPLGRRHVCRRCSSATSTPTAGGSSSSERCASRRRCSRRCGPTSSTWSSPARRRRRGPSTAGRSPRRRWHLGCDEVFAHDSVDDACAHALRLAEGDDAVLAAGSLYVAGAARSAFLRLAP